MLRYDSDDLKIIKEELCYEGFFKVKKFHFKYKLFNGAFSPVVTREVFMRSDSIALIAYDPISDKLVLIEQVRIGVYRKNNTPWLLELIGGMIDKNENDALKTAEREAQEEANIKVENLEKVLTFFETPGGTQERILLFAGKIDINSVKEGIYGLEQENEDIKVHIVTREQAYQWVIDGTIVNSIAIIGLQWLELNYLKLQKKWLS